MSEATEVLERIRRQENFTSKYTEENDTFVIKVKDRELFNDLTHEEKLKYSIKDNKYPVLNIFTHTWIYVTELDKWVLCSIYNTWNAELSIEPEYIMIDDRHLLDVDNHIVYERKYGEVPVCTEASSEENQEIY